MSTPTMRAPRSARWVAMALPIPAAAPVTIAICPSNCVLTVDLLLCRDGGLGRVRLRPAYDRPCRGAPAHRRRTTLTPPSSHRRSEEHTSELQSRGHLVCRLLLEKKKRQSLVVSRPDPSTVDTT